MSLSGLKIKKGDLSRFGCNLTCTQGWCSSEEFREKVFDVNCLEHEPCHMSKSFTKLPNMTVKRNVCSIRSVRTR